MGCLLEASRCLCDGLPRLTTTTRVVLFMHAVELAKPTNTGRFVAAMMPHASLVKRGAWATPDEPAPDLGDGPRFVLHPEAEHELCPEDAARRPTLLVPDGTWPQVRRMLNREPLLAGATRVRLPKGPPSRYRLRHHPSPHHLCTLESVARAVAVLEGESAVAPMLEFFERFVDASLRTRGVVP